VVLDVVELAPVAHPVPEIPPLAPVLEQPRDEDLIPQEASVPAASEEPEPDGERVPHLTARTAGQRHRVHVPDARPGLPEAEVDGVLRPGHRVLLAVETLLLDEGDQLAVAEDARARVVAAAVDAENEHACLSIPFQTRYLPVSVDF
jgi:hypothetical protein